MSVPILNASGCLDPLVAPEVARSLDAVVTKTITPEPREGNPPVRIAETEHGMLNSIGLQGPGIDRFVDEHLPRLAALGVPLWVSVGGFCAADFAEVCARLDDRPGVDTIELNLSCPNVEEAHQRRAPSSSPQPGPRPRSRSTPSSLPRPGTSPSPPAPSRPRAPTGFRS